MTRQTPAVSSPLVEMLERGRLAPGDGLLADLLRDIPDAVLLIAEDGRIVYWNRSAAVLFGLARGSGATEAPPPLVSALFPPSLPRARTIAALRERLRRDGRVENFETSLLRENGRVLDAISSLTAIRDERGAVVGCSAVIKDITLIKESERRIERRNAQLLAVNTVAEAVTELPGGRPLLDRVLAAVLRVTALGAGCVHLLDEEDEVLTLAARRGISRRAADLLTTYELGEGVIGQTAVLGETLIVSDTARDQRIARHRLSEERIGALVAVPLVAREGVRGVLTLFHDAPRTFTVHETGMLTAIGRQVGAALGHARLFDEVTAARREWEQTFDALTDGVSIHAPSGRIRRANKSLADLFSTTASTLAGMRCCELYHGAKKPRPDCTIMRTVTQRAGQRVELRERLYGRVLRVTTDPIFNAQGRVSGVVCTTRDVTEEKLIERRLIQQERISAVGELAAGIAHEVGTPLNIISANAEYLLRHKGAATERGNQRGKDELEAIREQAQGITALVRQLLDFAREQSPTFAPVNVNTLIERTLGLLAHQLNHARIKTELHLAPYISTVDGDAAQLQQVLFNLITNARQAMEAGAADVDDKGGGGTLRVTTDTALTPTESFPRPHVVVTVADTGRGIPADALPHVFKPFFTANKDGGTGLGLAISHRIVQRHSGLLTVETAHPRGTLVRLRLPLSQT